MHVPLSQTMYCLPTFFVFMQYKKVTTMSFLGYLIQANPCPKSSDGAEINTQSFLSLF